LSFTADELYECIPGAKEQSVFTEELYTGIKPLLSSSELKIVDDLVQVKAAVNKAIEAERGNGVIGGSLEVSVTLYASDDIKASLDPLDDELRFMLITSAADVKPLQEAPDDAIETEVEGLKMALVKLDHAKCVRCWHLTPDVGRIAAHPELCQRCVDNIDGSGEQRSYV
jgi:isoleucyl-tRNA synthetase